MFKRLIIGLALFALVPLFSEAQTTSCLTLVNSMGYGATDSEVNGEVTKLQNFLIAQGYLTRAATGNFLTLTQSAVQQFQIANGISSTGYVGPYTKAKIQALTCGSTSTTTYTPTCTDADVNGDGKVDSTDKDRVNALITKTSTSVGWDARADLNRNGVITVADVGLVNSLITSCASVTYGAFGATPTSGAAPLNVTFRTNRLGATIDFGDGTPASTVLYECTSLDPATYAPRCTVSHTYRTPGTYTATLSGGMAVEGTETASPITIRVTDTSSATTTGPTITTTSLPNATVGVPYTSATIVSTGGTGVRDWDITSGSLPPGVEFNRVACITYNLNYLCSQPATIGFFGTPTTAGTYTFTVTVTVGSQRASKSLTIVVSNSSSAVAQTLTASNCTIASGASTCSALMAWNSGGSVSSPNLYNATRALQYATTNSGSASYAITNGANTIQLRSGTTILKQATATGSCVSGTTWNGTICAGTTVGSQTKSCSVFVPSTLPVGSDCKSSSVIKSACCPGGTMTSCTVTSSQNVAYVGSGCDAYGAYAPAVNQGLQWYPYIYLPLDSGHHSALPTGSSCKTDYAFWKNYVAVESGPAAGAAALTCTNPPVPNSCLTISSCCFQAESWTQACVYGGTTTPTPTPTPTPTTGGATTLYCPVFYSGSGNNCMTGGNAGEIKSRCCASGTMTACVPGTGGVSILGTGCSVSAAPSKVLAAPVYQGKAYASFIPYIGVMGNQYPVGTNCQYDNTYYINYDTNSIGSAQLYTSSDIPGDPCLTANGTCFRADKYTQQCVTQ